MNFAKFVRALRNTESGQVHIVFGFYAMCFLILVGMAQFQLAAFRASSDYLEDALAAGDLASALIDVREYGMTHKLVIPDPEEAYATYRKALQTNLQLRENGTSEMTGMISGPVTVVRYEIYNVDEEKGTVAVDSLQGSGFVHRTGLLGQVKTPNGQTVRSTGVYSEVTYPLEGMFGMTITARKGKLAEVRKDK